MKRAAVDEFTEPPASPAGGSDAAFLRSLGQRVRQGRAVRGMSRKTLARLSDISERYIAQLEAGAGNVSIILLRRVAAATGCRLEDLIVESGADAVAWGTVRALLREATPAQVEQVRTMLLGGGHEISPNDGGDRVALIGLRGAGKSTVGAAAAARLGRPFVELNKEIEQDSGFAVAEIFSIYGQEGYRRFERDSLRRILERPGPMMLATGGGIVAEAATFDRLLSSFFTVWVKATPAEHMARVRRQGDLRPMAKDRAAMEELVTILSTREPLYARAAAVLDTSGATVDASVEALVRLVAGRAATAAKDRGTATV